MTTNLTVCSHRDHTHTRTHPEEDSPSLPSLADTLRSQFGPKVLRPHQSTVVTHIVTHLKRAHENKPHKSGLVIIHPTGSGKTLLSVALAEHAYRLFDMLTIIAAPPKLTANVEQEFSTVGLGTQNTLVVSYHQLVRLAKAYTALSPGVLNRVLLLVDESHHARNKNTQLHWALRSLSRHVRFTALLTATPQINDCGDLISLLNLTRQRQIESGRTFPLSTEFLERHFHAAHPNQQLVIRDEQKRLARHLRNCVSLVELTDLTGDEFPEICEETRFVRMNESEETTYLEQQEDSQVSWTSLRSPLACAQRDENLRYTDAFFLALRYACNVPSKFTAIVASLRPRALVFSNFIKQGVLPLSAYLRRTRPELRFGVITGATRPTDLYSTITDYNQHRLDVLLVSRAGSEGFDLKTTQQVHICEPSFHPATTQQIIGRTCRLNSHDTLPPDQRRVRVIHWITRLSHREDASTIEMRLLRLCTQKRQRTDAFLAFLRTQRIENARETDPHP